MSNETARVKFKIGDRLVATENNPSRRNMLAPHAKWNGSGAVVVGFGRQPQIVRVRRDGIKMPEAFHMNFWEKA